MRDLDKARTASSPLTLYDTDIRADDRADSVFFFLA